MDFKLDAISCSSQTGVSVKTWAINSSTCKITSRCVIANNADKKKKGRKNWNNSESKRDHMHGQPRLHVRIGNCTPRGIWVCRAAKWETPEQLWLHSQCTNISTLRRKWKQEGGGAAGEGYTDSSFTQNISPTARCLKDKESECFMPDGKQRQQFKTICIQHMHSLPPPLCFCVLTDIET